jgi:hypothetical protein
MSEPRQTIDRMRDIATAALPWGILGLLGASALGGNVSEGIHRLIQQNGAVLLLVAIIIQYAPRAIDAQKAQASAMADLAAAVRNAPQRSDLKFDEILIGQQLILDRQEALERRLSRGPD